MVLSLTSTLSTTIFCAASNANVTIIDSSESLMPLRETLQGSALFHSPLNQTEATILAECVESLSPMHAEVFEGFRDDIVEIDKRNNIVGISLSQSLKNILMSRDFLLRATVPENEQTLRLFLDFVNSLSKPANREGFYSQPLQTDRDRHLAVIYASRGVWQGRRFFIVDQ